MVSAKPGDQLRVLLGDHTLGTFDLSSLPVGDHEVLSLLGIASQKGVVTFELTGPEGDGASIRLDNLAINEAGLPPTIQSISPQTVAAGITLSVNVTATSSNPGEAPTFTLGSGAPAGATLEPSTALFNWTPNAAQAGKTYTIPVTVTENSSPPLAVSTTFDITVSEPRLPPSINPLASQIAATGRLLTVQVTATKASVQNKVAKASDCPTMSLWQIP